MALLTAATNDPRVVPHVRTGLNELFEQFLAQPLPSRFVESDARAALPPREDAVGTAAKAQDELQQAEARLETS